MNIKAFLKDKVGHFKDLPEDALEKLLTQAQITTFEPNEAIIEFGEEGRFMGVLLEGKAEVSFMDNLVPPEHDVVELFADRCDVAYTVGGLHLSSKICGTN